MIYWLERAEGGTASACECGTDTGGGTLTDTSEENGRPMNILLYVWRHYTLYAEDGHATVEGAIRAGACIADLGDGSPHGVEAGDLWITPKDNKWKAVERAMWDAQASEGKERPSPTYALEVMAPDGEWAQYPGVGTLDHAIEMAEEFKDARVRETGPGRQIVWRKKT